MNGDRRFSSNHRIKVIFEILSLTHRFDVSGRKAANLVRC